MRIFANIHIGERAEIKHTVSREDVQQFVRLTGDNNRLHTDKDFALTTDLKEPVVHGMLGASFISTVIGTKLPGDGALWYGQNLEFIMPVRIGDELTVVAEVVKKNQKHRIFELKTDIYNQFHQLVTTGLAKVKFVETEPSETDLVSDTATRNKVALVIGGTGGIGSEACIRLAASGFDVAVHYASNRQAASELVEAIRALGKKSLAVTADITDAKSVQNMVDDISCRLGGIGVVAHCGTAKIGNIKFVDLTWSEFQKHLDTNVKGLFTIAQAIVPDMERRGFGKFICVTTQFTEQPERELAHYIAAKSGMEGLSHAMALELAPKGIRVNLVSAGMTETRLIADMSEKTRILVKSRTPLRRLAQAADVADAIVFLASDRADFLTGETIRVNGGMVMR